MAKGKGIAAALGFTAIVLALCVLCAGAVLLGDYLLGEGMLDAGSAPEERRVLIVIDPGHGGMDGGAVGTNGALEKDINLSVAKKLYELCRIAGIDCRMTRESDCMLVDDSIKTRRKMHDLKNRVAFAEAAGSDWDVTLFVSLHMNNFSQSRYSGLQVWYSKNDERSKSLAAYLQTYARTYLDSANEREIKAAGSSIYVLDRIKLPAVLIECGFLSNPEECERLCNDKYQKSLASVIFAGLVGYIGGGM